MWIDIILFFDLNFGIFITLVFSVLVRRSEGREELIAWIFALTEFITYLKLQSYVFLMILYFVQFGLLTVMIVYKNKNQIYEDLEYMQINLDETQDNYQLTKEQFKVRYTQIEKINEGSQGQVFLYRDNLLKQNFAVKILSCTKKDTYEQQKNELDLLNQLHNYNNIIKIHKFVLEQEDNHTFQIFLVMDYAEGTLEDEIIKRQKKLDYFSQEQITQMIITLISALVEIKKNMGLQHRDIKPSNILKIQGQWFISDFGVSRLFNQNQSQQDQTHVTVIGTPAYMDPLLLKNYQRILKHQIDKIEIIDYFKSDVFSLGLTILQACILENVVNLNQDRQLLDKQLTELQNIAIFNQKTILCLKQLLTWSQQERPNFEEILYNFTQNL